MKVDYDHLATEYAQHRQSHPGVLKNLIRLGKVSATSRVLEAGCGTGNYILTLAKVLGCACWGVEPSSQMLATAKARNSPVHLKAGRAEQLDYPNEFFDLVFSVDVIHHVTDHSAYFREAHRVLRQGGKICTVTDTADIIRRRQPLSVYFPETVEVELQRYPHMVDLHNLMIKAGFIHLQEMIVELRYTLTDIQSYQDKAFSCLHLISNAAYEEGIRRMEQDLSRGPIVGVSRYVLLWGTK